MFASGGFITGEIHIFTKVKNRLSTIEKKYRNSIFKIGPRKVTDREGRGTLCARVSHFQIHGENMLSHTVKAEHV